MRKLSPKAMRRRFVVSFIEGVLMTVIVLCLIAFAFFCVDGLWMSLIK